MEGCHDREIKKGIGCVGSIKDLARMPEIVNSLVRIMTMVKKLVRPIVKATANGCAKISIRRFSVYDNLNKLKFLVDSGADIPILPVSKFRNDKRVSDVILTAANGSTI